MADFEIITPVVMCGGKGTRLWPLSRSARPKQFLQLTGDHSQFQKTLMRVADSDLYSAPIVITNAEYRFLVAEQADEVGVRLASLVLEPMPRNTAAAIAVGCIVASSAASDPLVHILPSDHEILVDDRYRKSVRDARAAALAGQLVTFGIHPSEPETGFGYIQAGESIGEDAFAVARFVEKPNAVRAAEMIETGDFLWNSGMFMFRAGILLDECAKFAPAVLSASNAAVADAVKDLDFVRLDASAFSNAPDISVDYAIFEKTDRAAVVRSPIEWSDLGSWDAVWKSSPKDSSSNVARGPATVENMRRSLVITEKLHVVAANLDDVAIIASEDAIYVGKLSEAQSVGATVKNLSANVLTRPLTETHQTSYRPWGGYASLAMGDRFQVKRLFVKPGKRLSLQRHHHRAEHWIVVRGTAEVQVGEEVRMLQENESIYIPLGEVHRLSNPGRILLEIIEVQSGSYLGEDDIIRLEDQYGRA